MTQPHNEEKKEKGHIICHHDSCTVHSDGTCTPSSGMKWEKFDIEKNIEFQRLLPDWVDIIQAHENHKILCSRQGIVKVFNQAMRYTISQAISEARAEAVLKGERRRIIEQLRGEIEADIRKDERMKVVEEILRIKEDTDTITVKDILSLIKEK